MKKYITSILAILFITTSASADIYRYVDKNGVIHFTDTPTHSGFKMYLRTGLFNVKDYKEYFKKYDEIIYKYAQTFGVEYSLVKAVIRAESGYDPNAVSKKGAQGLMQLMPDTASDFNCDNPMDPESNIKTGIKYLKYLMNYFKDDLKLALAAYNAGPRNVVKYGYKIPPFNETRNYVKKVMEYYRFYSDTAAN